MTAYEFLAEGLFLRAIFFSSTIPYGDIKGARVANFFQLFSTLNPFRPPAVGLVRGIYWRYVLFETKKARLFILTPDDPESFVQILNEKLQAH
jgi:hypothetical protein